MPVKKEIIFPIFLECCQFCTDTFWENVFEDLAYGKTPYGTYISKNFLCCSYKKKEFTYKIERKDIKVFYTEVFNLLSKKLCLSSPKDLIKQKEIFELYEFSNRFSRDNWSDIRKKSIKELLLELFVINMKNKHKLSIKQARYLISTIFIAMVFKIISSNDISYNDGNINSIEGIEFSKGKTIINKKLYNITNILNNSVVTHPEKKKMSHKWDKYLKDLKKNTKF
tara:strand:+ start:239 stop:913 length:675 start_codon:yes stop_codon:yes gene_type:complete